MIGVKIWRITRGVKVILAAVVVIIIVKWLIKISSPWDGFFFKIPASKKPKWEHFRNINFEDLVKSNEDTHLIYPERLFNAEDPPLPSAVIFVISKPASVDRRNGIRTTWAKWCVKYNIDIIFFLGKPPNENDYNELLKESKEHKDIVVDNFEESYYALPIKVLRAMKFYMKVYHQHLMNNPFFAKIDDDTYLNIPNFAKLLTKWFGNGEMIAGKPNRFSKIARHDYTSIYMPYEVIGGYWYPTYNEGPFYTISGDLIPMLYRECLKSDYFPFEDVFIHGIVANKKLGLGFTHIDGVFLRRGEKSLDMRRDEFKKSVAISSASDSMQMLEIHYKVVEAMENCVCRNNVDLSVYMNGIILLGFMYKGILNF